MSKKYKTNARHESGRTITTKSPYGSHSEMIVETDIKLLLNEVVCKDDEGLYITTKDRIDSGLADPNRYGNRRVA